MIYEIMFLNIDFKASLRENVFRNDLKYDKQLN